MAVTQHELVINDNNWQEHVDITVDGSKKARGLVPRDYSKVPVGFYKNLPPAKIINVPRNEYVSRIQEMEAHKSRLSDIRRRSGPNSGHIPSLDQNGQGYCWMYSGTMASMLFRAKMGLPYVRLSGHAGACLVKQYRDEGGWGAQGVDHQIQHGQPTIEFWPEKSMNRANDTAAMRANALLHKMTGVWADLSVAQYDRNLTDDQAFTFLFNCVPVIGDFNWWGHSVCLMDPVLMASNNNPILKTDFGSLDLNNPKDADIMYAVFGKRGINSWTDSYGDLGEFVLSGSKALLDGGCAPGNVLAA